MRKTILISLLILGVIAVSFFLYLKHRKLDDFEPQIKAKLQELIKTGSGGLYVLEVDKINADVVKSRIILSNIHLTYDSAVYKSMIKSNTAPADLFTLRLKSLAVDGITPVDLLKKKNLNLNIIYVDQPQLEIFHHNSNKKDGSQDTGSFYQRIRNELGSFELKKLLLRNLDLTYHNMQNKVQSSFKDLFIEFDSILVNSETQFDTTRFLYAKDATISLKDFMHKTADSIYTLKLDSIAIKAARNIVTIKNLQLAPRVTKAEYRKIMKVRKDRYSINVNDIVLDNINWWRFLADEGLFIGNGTIANGDIEVYSDKGIPAGNEKKIGGYPHQQLFKADLPLYVGKIGVKRLNVTYSERNIKTGKEGDLVFKNTYATLNNITNIADSIKRRPNMTIDATSSFMGSGALKAGFNFSLARQKEGIFSVYADLGELDGTVLNKAVVPLASVEIEKARLRRLKVNINGNNYDARGKILLTYTDLKIQVLKKDDDGSLKNRGLVSFIANNFKINKEYPKKGEKAEAFNSYHKRPLEKSFFSLIWKTIFGGLKQTVGI